MAKQYKAHIMTMSYPRHATVTFKSRAKTHDGILKALGKAIAREVHDDAIAVTSLFVENTDSPLGLMKRVPLTLGDKRMVFLYTKDALFDILYC